MVIVFFKTMLMPALLVVGVQGAYRFNLAPAPSPFPSHQAFYNASRWSWGGSLIHVPDDAQGFEFHMFAEAELGACGVHAWQTNARVIHAVSKVAEGPYKWSDDPLPGVWHAGPDISRAADGTFLLWTMSSNATPVHCIDGVGNYSCPPDPATGRKPKPGYPCVHNGLFRNRLYASKSPYGPWSEVHNATGGDAIPASINANAVAHPLPNGTVIVIGSGLHIAQHWSGPYVKQNHSFVLTDPRTRREYDFKACPSDSRNKAHVKWPNATCALEDSFFWFDQNRQRWRWMAHQKLRGAGSRALHQCDYFPGVGGFAESQTDDFWSPWDYDFWAPAYSLYTKLSNGTNYCLESRERPKMLIVGNRTFLTNSACPTQMGPGDSGCFTFLQEVLSENEPAVMVI